MILEAGAINYNVVKTITAKNIGKIFGCSIRINLISIVVYVP